MNILVTGASGLLGREVLQRLNLQGDVNAVGIWNRNQIEPGIQADLLDAHQCEGAINTVNPDIVVHCAADRDPDSCERNPEQAEKMNLGILRDLLRLTDHNTKFVFISSDYVFSGECPPYAEDSKTAPINVYGKHKVEGEKLVLDKPDSLVLRVPLLIGAGPSWEESGFLYKTWKAVLSKNPLEVDDSGVRFPTWTRDVADFIVWLIRRNEAGVFHFRGLRGKTKFGWACEVAEMIHQPTDHIKPSVDPASLAKRPKDTHLTLSRMESLGYNQIHDFREVFEEVMNTHGVCSE